MRISHADNMRFSQRKSWQVSLVVFAVIATTVILALRFVVAVLVFGSILAIFLFPLIALVFFLLIPRNWRVERLRRGRCVKCNYDLRASTDRCPECGTLCPPRELSVDDVAARLSDFAGGSPDGRDRESEGEHHV
jgi:hypothetical protein